ncbi:4Fe-4S dicluster domain-containing protein [Eggerthellaceae bacterium zg-886]|uniref:4Fe-4S dicluster domain-containing protein n=2 Tax=Xiamenia xianingshaonis TaxID=2682776 RepID=A0ABX0IEM1_9ACTN|nr:4Fe-4S dicluster domain-containing protein [Xiamenia xianingshaonis]
MGGMTNVEMGAMVDIIGGVESQLLHVHKNRCVLVRHRHGRCLRCAEVCTTGAIALTDDGITVSPQLCIGCGTCATACPTGCLEAANPTDEELFGQMEASVRESGGLAVVACSAARAAIAQTAGSPNADTGTAWTADGVPAVPVECLGRADESLVVQATAQGAARLVLVSSDCAACAHHAGGTLCAEACACAAALLEAVGATSPVERMSAEEALDAFSWAAADAAAPQTDGVLDPAAHEASPTASPTARTAPSAASLTRRDPRVRTAVRRSVPKSKFAHVQADGTLPHFVPERRLRLFNSLKAMGSPERGPVRTRLWGAVSINTDLCRSCRICTVFCPTGALSRFDTADGSFGADFRPTLCVQCRLCETVCLEGAITVSDEVSTDEFLRGTKRRFTMPPLEWNPNGPTSIPTRMARLFKTNVVQDPQVTLNENEVAKLREYAARRDEERRCARKAAEERDR